MIRLSGLWKRESKDGKTYLSGYMGQAQLLIFPVEKTGDSETEPDFVLYLAERTPDGTGNGAGKGKGKQKARQSAFDM